ncbi:protein FAR1-RELATED SEQUENCE 5-like [Arachis stenosperma]|uniref:protein FAR1-RELATED SEQUENCE 5-like n=1 Tax=Arachis stenosperma TaxID=217475 RepID=UPI0025AD3172|nr:protein FAR1-RELATED SEQUENCE 5-like [Arachis stenosperma]
MTRDSVNVIGREMNCVKTAVGRNLSETHEMSDIFIDTEMDEQYQEDDDINQQEELVCDQDMMDEQNEFEQDFGDEFTEGAYFFESDPSEDTVEAAYAVDSVQDITTLNSVKIVRRKLMFGLLASQAGGYEFVSYGPIDLYNEISWQRHQVPGDAARVLKKLEDMRLKDPLLYFKACHDSRGLLRNLFWSDGISQLDYQLFGHIIAFDATYKKNKYSCPLVIFSGVNHHNQTIIFATALIMDETTDTNIWLLH